MKTFNYSIIIPHRNIPQLLQRCIDSIPSREDLQIIIVDDNSDEGKVDFANFPGLNNPNTEVYFTKEGKGAGYARNVGLQHAKGKWLLFADSDDTFVTDNLNAVLDHYKDSQHEYIIMNSNLYDADTLELLEEKKSFQKRIERGSDEDKEWLRYSFTNPWCKLVSKRFVDKYQITFDEVSAGNDVMFSLKCGHYSKYIHVDSTVVYNWIIRKTNSITATINEKSVFDKLNVAVRKNKFLKENQVSSKNRVNLFVDFMWAIHLLGHSYLKSFFIIFNVTDKTYLISDTYFLLREITNRVINSKKM